MTDSDVARLTLLATILNLQVNIDILDVSKQRLDIAKEQLDLFKTVYKDKLNAGTIQSSS